MKIVGQLKLKIGNWHQLFGAKTDLTTFSIIDQILSNQVAIIMQSWRRNWLIVLILGSLLIFLSIYAPTGESLA